MRKKEEEGNREYPSQKARKFRDFLKRKMTFSAYHSKVKEGAETQKSVKGKKILHLMPNRGKRKGNKENHQEKQVEEYIEAAFQDLEKTSYDENLNVLYYLRAVIYKKLEKNKLALMTLEKGIQFISEHNSH